LALTRRTQRFPPMILMAAGTALYGIGFALYGLVSLYSLFLAAMAIITIGEMLVVPVSQALVAQFAPEDMRGRYMAIFGFSYGVPFAIGPLLAGAIMDNVDPRWLWYLAGCVGALGAFAFLLLHPLLKRKPVASLPLATD